MSFILALQVRFIDGQNKSPHVARIATSSRIRVARGKRRDCIARRRRRIVHAPQGGEDSAGTSVHEAARNADYAFALDLLAEGRLAPRSRW